MDKEEEEDDSKNYFYEPPVNTCTLNFYSANDETCYRNQTSVNFLSPEMPQVICSDHSECYHIHKVGTCVYVYNIDES